MSDEAEARDRETGCVSDEKAEEAPEQIVVEEFIILREKKDPRRRRSKADPRVKFQKDERAKRPL